MDEQEQRIAIAEACGWTSIEACTCSKGLPRGIQPNGEGYAKHIPDYLSDLNAMRDAIMAQPPQKRFHYAVTLQRLVSVSQYQTVTEHEHWALAAYATAAQRAEAFLKTLDLWKP